MNILIVDDHPMVMAGLSERLAAMGHKVMQATDLEEGNRQLSQTSIDLCILDIDLGGEQGTDLLTAAATTRPLFVLLSGTKDRDQIAMALDDGADAFIPKNVRFEEVIQALSQALSGQVAQGEGLIWISEKLCFEPYTALYPKGSILSAREREVFRLMRDGLSDKQIASQLERSIHTIRVQIRSIQRKRGLRRRTETCDRGQ